MLLRFSIENVLCFNTETTFSMVASSDVSHPTHVAPVNARKRARVVRASALYGANGHGKTCFVEAIDILREIVLEKRDDTDKILISRFKLDKKRRNLPSRFTIEFRKDNEDYEYGIVIGSSHIEEEWLFVTPLRGAERKIFERQTKPRGKTFSTSATFGAALEKSRYKNGKHKMGVVLDILAETLPPFQTLLNEASNRDVDATRSAYLWFAKVLTPISATSTYAPLFERAKEDKVFLQYITQFLKSTDTGIADFELKEGVVESSSIPANLGAQLQQIEHGDIFLAGGPEGAEMLFEKSKDGKILSFRFVSKRKGEDGTVVDFELREESAGTRRLIDLLPMTMGIDGEERVYVVDELDRKMHPILAKKIVETFLLNGTGQLIFTTHNTYLMDLELFRRDEIWFVQKKNDGSSELYSLSDMKVRPDLDVRRGYLNGRFGAIPFLGNIDALGLADGG